MSRSHEDIVLNFFLSIFRTPFDEDSIYGFATVCFLNYVGASIFVVISVVIPLLFLILGLFCKTFEQHFGIMYAEMNELVGQNRTIDLKLSLIESIKFHNQIKE